MSENLILKTLIFSIIFFMICLFACEIFFPNDGQIFQVVAGLVTGFTGAFLALVRNKLGIPDPTVPPPPGVQRTTTIDNSTVVKEETKKD